MTLAPALLLATIAVTGAVMAGLIAWARNRKRPLRQTAARKPPQAKDH